MRGPQKHHRPVRAEPIAAERVSADILSDAREGSAALLKAIAQYHFGQGRKAWRVLL